MARRYEYRRRSRRPRRRTRGLGETAQQRKFAKCARRICKGEPGFRACMRDCLER